MEQFKRASLRIGMTFKLTFKLEGWGQEKRLGWAWGHVIQREQQVPES